MDREDLDRQLKEQGGKENPGRKGSSRTKKMLLAAAVCLILIGGAGGYIMHDLPFMRGGAAEKNYTMPQSGENQSFELPGTFSTGGLKSGRAWAPA